MPAALVPELSVRDCRVSAAFYVGLLGFETLFERPEEGFAYLRLGEADLMLDQIGLGRDFPGVPSPRDRPFGRGVNLQIAVPATAPILERLAAAGVALALGPEERWYRRGDVEIGQRQFLVADPDGYLLRPWEPLGLRPAP